MWFSRMYSKTSQFSLGHKSTSNLVSGGDADKGQEMNNEEEEDNFEVENPNNEGDA
jgi:hypothetical protein